MADQQHIKDEGNLKRYFTEIPNIVDDLGLDPYQRALYIHYKRVCGANGGTCEEGVRTTAKRTQMSMGKVSEARSQLAEKGLIIEHKQPPKEGQINCQVYITVADIWDINFAYYACKNGRPDIMGWTVQQLKDWHKRSPGERSPNERTRSPDERKANGERSPGEQKKEPCSKKELRKERGGASRSPMAAISRNLTDLPDPEAQMAILFPSCGSGSVRDFMQSIQVAGWEIRNVDIRRAAALFLKYSGLPIPNSPSTRGDWIKSLKQQVDDFGVSVLEEIYPLAIADLRSGGLTIGRPGSLSNTLPAICLDLKNGGSHAPPHKQPANSTNCSPNRTGPTAAEVGAAIEACARTDSG